jgi:hypothetical protein
MEKGDERRVQEVEEGCSDVGIVLSYVGLFLQSPGHGVLMVMKTKCKHYSSQGRIKWSTAPILELKGFLFQSLKLNLDLSQGSINVSPC